MKTIICDRCKKIVGEAPFKDARYIKARAINHSRMFDNFLGIEREFEFCEECFNEYWDFIKK